jgi:hypothetical protein
MQRGRHSSRREPGRFNQRGPSVPPKKDYVPTRSAQKPPFHTEIEAASALAQDSPEFISFVRDVVNMPVEMAPAVFEAIRQQRWKISPNPLAGIRTAAHQEAKRMGLEPGPGAPNGRP